MGSQAIFSPLKKPLLGLVLILVAGCGPNRQEIVSTCEDYGFVKGSETYAECIFRLEENAQHRRVQKALILQDMSRSVHVPRASFYEMKAPQRNNLNCTTMDMGSTTSINCY